MRIHGMNLCLCVWGRKGGCLSGRAGRWQNPHLKERHCLAKYVPQGVTLIQSQGLNIKNLGFLHLCDACSDLSYLLPWLSSTVLTLVLSTVSTNCLSCLLGAILAWRCEHSVCPSIWRKPAASMVLPDLLAVPAAGFRFHTLHYRA